MNEPQAPVVASNSLFDRCAETKRMKDGSLEIHCKRGLWAVRGQDHNLVKREAMSYFALYYSDGEYDLVLSNPTVLRSPRLGGDKQDPVVGQQNLSETK